MKYIDLKKGEYYYCTSYSGYIMQNSKDERNCDMISISSKNYTKRSGGFDGTTLDFRDATAEEKAWLKACQKADKTILRSEVKLDEIINDYPIY